MTACRTPNTLQKWTLVGRGACDTQVVETSGQGSMVTINVQRLHRVCRDVQKQAVLGAVQSCADRPAGAEVILKSSLTVSVVGEAPKDARLHTRSCTYTENPH